MKKIYSGISYLTLDSKNRLFIPQKYRSEDKKYVLTCGVDQCINIYSYTHWEEVVKKIDSLSLKNKTHQRTFIRTFFAEAEIVEIDNQGRILIPNKFKQMYKIKNKVVLVGNRDRIELWEHNTWEKYYKNAQRIIAKIKSQIDI